MCALENIQTTLTISVNSLLCGGSQSSSIVAYLSVKEAKFSLIRSCLWKLGRRVKLCTTINFIVPTSHIKLVRIRDNFDQKTREYNIK